MELTCVFMLHNIKMYREELVLLQYQLYGHCRQNLGVGMVVYIKSIALKR